MCLTTIRSNLMDVRLGQAIDIDPLYVHRHTHMGSMKAIREIAVSDHVILGKKSILILIIIYYYESFVIEIKFVVF